ncbi:hypothetical protein [Cloacibacillus porcorum]|uniref:Peptidase n=1 Tax=Cloacibacillus porcorum TaxID=1197717 RepID=A0A1B2I2N1_9BACT|nr:hypothetical protein [Cloacibacillus porcorum]ANZ44216.1 hypothetical protein BED41_03395 [Cloacibacillus porcorum]
MTDETAVTQNTEGTPPADPAAAQTADNTAGGELERTLLTDGIGTETAAKAGGADRDDLDKDSKEGDEGDKGKEPSVPERYELTMLEGWGLDEDGLAELTPIMQGLGASNEQVQAIADLYVRRLSAAREAQLAADAATVKAWQDEIVQDPEIGGPALEENLAAVSRVLARYAGDEFVGWMKDTNLGNYPPFVKAMVKMAKDLSDDSFIPGGRGGGMGGDPMKEAANLIYGKI